MKRRLRLYKNYIFEEVEGDSARNHKKTKKRWQKKRERPGPQVVRR